MTDPEAHPPEHSPAALREVYAELRRLAEQGLGQPYDLAIAERVGDLVAGPLAEIKRALLARQAECLPARIAAIVELGRGLDIADFEDADFVAAFGHAWGGYFDRRLRQPVATGFFADIQAGLAVRCEEAGRALAGPRRVQREEARRLSELEARLAGADFKRRREIGHELAALRNRLVGIEEDIADREMHALRALLPPDVAYESLSIHPSTLAFAPGQYHPTALAALFSPPGAEMDTAPVAAPAPVPLAEFAPEPEPEPEFTPEPAAAPDDILGLNLPGPDDGSPPPAWLMHWLQPESPEAEVPGEDQAGMAPATLADLLLEAVPAGEPENPPEPEPAPEIEAAPEPPPPPPAASEPAPAVELPALTAYLPDAETATGFFHAAYPRAEPVALARAIENVAFHWIDRGYLNVAYATLHSARSSGLPLVSLFEPDLFKAAYFGMNLWSGEEENLAPARQALEVLPLDRLDAWHARHPGGAAVPYLLFVAGWQPALFGGAATAAPALLDWAAPRLGPVARQAIHELTDPARPPVSLDSLRRTPGGGGESGVRSKLAGRLRDWHDRVIHKQTGWEPVRLALNDCLARPEFKRALTAIATDADDVEGVAALVECYRDRNAIAALLEAQLANLYSAVDARPLEDRNAKSWFTLNLIDLCGIADDWLAEARAKPSRRGGAGSGFAEWITKLREEFDGAAHHAPDFEGRVGAKLAAQSLGNLRRAVADGQSGVVWSAKQTHAFLSLPYDMMKAVGFSGDAEGELVWLVDRLCSVPAAE